MVKTPNLTVFVAGDMGTFCTFVCLSHPTVGRTHEHIGPRCATDHPVEVIRWLVNGCARCFNNSIPITLHPTNLVK